MIHLVLSSLPVDEVPGHLSLAIFFEDQRPLKGASSLIDWRLNGKVSELIMTNRLHGHLGDSLMMPAHGRLSTREIFIFGLGPLRDFNEKVADEVFGKLIQKLIKLKSPEIVVSFGDLARDFMSWRTILRSFMNHLSLNHDEVQVICTEDPRWIGEAKKRNMDFGPKVQVGYA